MTDEHGNEHVDLSQFDEAFAAAPEQDEDVPDGKYDVSVERVEIARARTSGQPMLKWTLKVLDPDYAGRMLWRNNVLATDENAAWLKKDLKKCGLALEKLSDLQANLEKLLDVKLVVTKKTKDEFSNVYINRRLREDELATAAGTPSF